MALRLGQITLILALLLSSFAGRAQDESDYRLTNVTDDVFRFTAGNYHALVIKTDDGIVLIDPLNTRAASWIKKTVAERFNKPITHLIYSHSHPDHAYGGEVFDDGNTVLVSHQDARANLKRVRADTALPSLVFNDTLTLFAGGKDITLTYYGPTNGYGNVAVHVQPDDVMFVVDWVVVGRLPYKDLMGYDLEGTLRATEKLLKQPFTHFVGGHADMGNKDDVNAYYKYIQTLHNSVLEGILAGKSLKDIQRSQPMAEFSSLKMYDEWVELNIKGAYEQLVSRSYLKMRESASGQ
ncbi:MBL fold metallo-hydrolase [Alteromonas antoniana]|uniref:MBL fold metallo-hydrolase n=1 Tax=Alteromonas antoniana TaxID=2803813 RepID=UPI001C46A26A